MDMFDAIDWGNDLAKEYILSEEDLSDRHKKNVAHYEEIKSDLGSTIDLNSPLVRNYKRAKPEEYDQLIDTIGYGMTFEDYEPLKLELAELTDWLNKRYPDSPLQVANSSAPASASTVETDLGGATGESEPTATAEGASEGETATEGKLDKRDTLQYNLEELLIGNVGDSMTYKSADGSYEVKLSVSDDPLPDENESAKTRKIKIEVEGDASANDAALFRYKKEHIKITGKDVTFFPAEGGVHYLSIDESTIGADRLKLLRDKHSLEWRENPEFMKIAEQVDGNDFWNPEDIRVVKSGTDTVVYIPVGATQEIRLIQNADGEWDLYGFEGMDTKAIQGNMDDAFENAALVQRMLSEVAVGRWRMDDSWIEDEAFTRGYTGALAFDSFGDGYLPISEALAGGFIASTGGLGTPLAAALYSQFGGTDSSEMIEGDDTQVLALMNECYRKMNTNPETGQYESYTGQIDIPEGAPTEISDAINGVWFDPLNFDGSNIWNKDKINIEKIDDEHGATRWGIDIPVEGLNPKSLCITGESGRWTLHGPDGLKIKFGEDLEDAMDTAALIQNLSLEVVSGKYSSDASEPFQLHPLLPFVIFDGGATEYSLAGAAPTLEIMTRGREIIDEEPETVVAILNTFYRKLKHSRKETLLKDIAKREAELAPKEDSDTTDTTPAAPGAGGSTPGPGGDTLPGGGTDADPDTDGDGDPGDDPAGGSKDAAGDGKTGTGSSRGPKDGSKSPDHEHDDEEDAPEKPSDRGFMETHETLQLFNAFAQNAFGKDKDYRARIMRKLRKRKRGKAEGRDRRTRFPVVRTTKFEVKDGQVTWKFRDTLDNSGPEIVYKSGSKSADGDANMVTEHGITYADTAANRKAIQEFFQGTIFKLKERPVNEGEIAGRKKDVEKALDQGKERRDMRRKWRNMKDQFEDAAKASGKRVRVSFGWRRPYMVNKTVKIKVKGQAKKKLLVSLDYEDRDVTAKIKDEGGKLFSDIETAVQSVVGDAEGRRKRKARRKRKSVEDSE